MSFRIMILFFLNTVIWVPQKRFQLVAEQSSFSARELTCIFLTLWKQFYFNWNSRCRYFQISLAKFIFSTYWLLGHTCFRFYSFTPAKISVVFSLNSVFRSLRYLGQQSEQLYALLSVLFLDLYQLSSFQISIVLSLWGLSCQAFLCYYWDVEGMVLEPTLLFKFTLLPDEFLRPLFFGLMVGSEYQVF